MSDDWIKHPKAGGLLYPPFCKDYEYHREIGALIVGDIIPYVAMVREVIELIGDTQYRYTVHYANGAANFAGTAPQPLSPYVHVLRRPADAAVRAKKPSSGSPWNDRCVKCGKGMYVGFMDVEHEGGACK